MNERDRFVRCLQFKAVDRVPDMEMGVWPETLARWRREGLPWWVGNLFQLSDHLRMDKSFNCDWLPIHNEIYPEPETRIVEERPDWVVTENSLGMRARQGRTNASIPQYLRFPVEGPEDYDRLARFLDPGDAGRYRPDFDADLLHRTGRGELRGVSFSGLFGFPRSVMGLENYCLALHDQPDLVRRLLDDRVHMARGLYPRALAAHAIDFVQIWEDMSYKSGPLVSPSFMEGHMVGRYRTISHQFRSAGVPLVMMDSDGNVDRIAPLLEPSGIEGLYPCERAAGADPVSLRRAHPRLALMGGIDKRVVARGGAEEIREEFRRLRPVLREGGFIPFIDHFIPPDVSYPDFLLYLGIKREFLANPA